jgi:hypothetical protein
MFATAFALASAMAAPGVTPRPSPVATATPCACAGCIKFTTRLLLNSTGSASNTPIPKVLHKNTVTILFFITDVSLKRSRTLFEITLL